MDAIHIGDVLGDYKVIDIAGAGGMGAVYKIEHAITRRIEAMKLLPPGSNSDPEQAQRFEREIQVQARLHHPNIAALYTAVRFGDAVALLMEFVEGEPLRSMLEAGPLPVDTAVDFACQVLGALAYAHQAGVIHRDVAPANIIITPERVAKLTDFGLARGAVDLRLSTSGAPMGSPWYMSPEQVKGELLLDPRSDLYSMGAVLYEMLTGAKLFEGEGAFAVMRAHVEQEAPLASALVPSIPAALDGTVRKALAKDPECRFQSADEFRLALQQAAIAGSAETPGQLIPAAALMPPVSPAPRYRRSRAAWLIALVPVGLVAGVFGVRWIPAVRPTVSKAQPALSPAAAAPAPTPPIVVDASVPPDGAPNAPAPPPASDDLNPVVCPRPAKRPAAQAVVPVRRTRPGSGLRVGGPDTQPSEPCPLPSRTVTPPPAISAKTTPKLEVPAPPPAEKPVEASTPPEESPAPQDAAPADAQKGGNRLVRALGKINPFRKRNSGEAAKPQPAKDEKPDH